MGFLNAKTAGLLFLIIFVVLQTAIWDAPDLDVFGASVPTWLVALASYLLGIGAGVATERSRARR